MTDLNNVIRKSSGITLIELLVVLSIVVILIVAMGFQFSGWQGKYRMESQVKQLYSDLVGARTRAMQRGASCFLDFPSAAAYELKDDTNGNGILGAGDAVVNSTYPKTISYTLGWNNEATPSDIPLLDAAVAFDRRGMISYFDKTGTVSISSTSPRPAMISFTSTENFNPDYDCIVIGQTQIGTGKKVCSNNSALTCNEDTDCTGGSCSVCQER